MFPNDAQSAKCTQATAIRCDLIATSTSDFTVLQAHLSKNAQASQLIRCTNGTSFKTIVQAVGTNPQDIYGHYKIPSGYSCHLQTFDGTLTHSSITWVDYDLSLISSSTQSSTTDQNATNTAQYINGFSYGEIIIGFFLLIIVSNHFFGGILDRLIGAKQKKYIIRL